MAMERFVSFASLTTVTVVLALLVKFQITNAADSKFGQSPSSSLTRLDQVPLKFHQSKITLSGFSAGGTFAQMMQFVYSSLFHGVAVFSHNYYRCGPPNGVVVDYDKVCTKLHNLTDGLYDTDLVHRDIDTYMRAGQIENVGNLRNRKLYVYAGLSSFLFTIEQSLNILKVYERYIQNPKAIMTRVQDANLVLPTNGNKGVPCKENANKKSFIGNCGLNGAHEALNFLLSEGRGNSDLVEPQPGQRVHLQPLRTFDQSVYTSGINNHHMDSIGYIYVPSSGCAHTKCLLHFYFHGCFVGRELNGTKHIENSGYLEVAELNNIIVVFPQALSSLPNNAIGCWDTFGIGGPLYATNEGPQIRVVRRILDTFLKSNGGGFRPSNIGTGNGNGNGNFGPPPFNNGAGFRPPGQGIGGGYNRPSNNFQSSGSFSSASASSSSKNNRRIQFQ